jgi:hypothetical protein
MMCNVQQNTKYHTCDWLLLFLKISLYTTKGGPTQRYINIFNCIQIKKWPLGKTDLWLKEYTDNNCVYLFKYWKSLTINHYSSSQLSLLHSTVDPAVPPKSVNFTMPISFEIHHNILSKCTNFENRCFAHHLYFRPSYFCAYSDTSLRF